jgi:peptidoglycan/LPS O-acetylase OafA/YrhL
MSAHASKSNRESVNCEIESLRAIAIILTLLQHLPVMLYWPNPPAWMLSIYNHTSFWCGVDLFFVVSGFVVTQSLLNAFDSANREGLSRWVAVKRFWVRRAFRLFPMAWLWVAMVLVASRFLNDSGAFGSFSDNATQALWILVHLYNWFAYGWFVSGVNIAPLGIYWSLALEEQFYVLLPLLLVLRNKLLYAVLVIAIAAQFFIWRPAPWLEPMWALRFDALIWGVLLAFFVRESSRARQPLTWLSSRAARWLANILLLIGISIMPSALMPFSATTGLLAMVCALYVWLASFERGYVFPIGRFQPILDWFGSRSYAIYVVHVAAFMLTRELAFRVVRANGSVTDWDRAISILAAGLALTFIFAEICHRLLEQPLRDWGRRLACKIN